MEVYRLLAGLWIIVSASGSPAPVGNSLNIESQGNAPYNATSVPKYTYIGKTNGEIDRCLYDNPAECERFFKAGAKITSIVVYGEFLYVSTGSEDSGQMLRCELQKVNSCVVFNTADSTMSSLTIKKGFILAGLHNGNILRCKPRRPNNCFVLHTVGNKITAVLAHEDNIYVGTDNKRIIRCSNNSCTDMFLATDGIAEFSVVNDSIFAITYDNRLWNCTYTFDFCEQSDLPKPNLIPVTMKFFNGLLYVVGESQAIVKCKLTPVPECSNYVHHEQATAIAFSYATYGLDRQKNCTGQENANCPPPYVTFVRDVDFKEAELEVNVRGGKLYNSHGLLVDTTKALPGESGTAAMFVMAPEGKLLLMNDHIKHFLDIPSLLDGNPISGGGEIVVFNGVIKEMYKCVEHYPGLKSNDQVVESLRSQGYKGPINNNECPQKLNSLIIEPNAISTPKFAYIGKINGEIDRCLYDTPAECEKFFDARGWIHSLKVYGEFLYATAHLTNSDQVLRCKLREVNSCVVLYTTDSRIFSMTIERGYIFAGLLNGNVLRCELHQTNSCLVLHTVADQIHSVLVHGDHIFVGTPDCRMIRCSLNSNNSCVYITDKMDVGIEDFYVLNDSIFAFTEDSKLWNYTYESDGNLKFNKETVLPVPEPRHSSMATLFDEFLFVVTPFRRQVITKCKLSPVVECSSYVDQEQAGSIAFTYATYQMDNKYRNEQKSCTWQEDSKCPPYVMYYNVQDRQRELEVIVKGGKLYNSRGLVDTTKASQGTSGTAAIFVMGPDGKLLLSNTHSKNFKHTSSLLAGNPISGGGEIVVVNGEIKEMYKCTEHYPGLESNYQVVHSLLLQGYKGPINNKECPQNPTPSNDV